MFQGLSLPALIGLFVAATAAVWYAGMRLVDATDIIDERYHLSTALGGTLLLAIATNLPEVAIAVSAALAGNTGIIVGNVLGGIAIQTVILVLLDFRTRGEAPLTQRVDDLIPALEAVLVIAILGICIMATQLPASIIVARVPPGPLLIAVLWLAGIWLISRANRGLPWRRGDAARASSDDGSSKVGDNSSGNSGRANAVLTFTWAAAITLAAGVVLEKTSHAIADEIGVSGVLFGATVLAAATSLPEISTGLRAIAKRDYALAISDIFGGNAFLPVLFLPVALISGHAVLPLAERTDIYLAALGTLLTCVYLAGLLFQRQRKLWGLGVDSILVLVIYAVGMVGLMAVAFAR